MKLIHNVFLLSNNCCIVHFQLIQFSSEHAILRQTILFCSQGFSSQDWSVQVRCMTEAFKYVRGGMLGMPQGDIETEATTLAIWPTFQYWIHENYPKHFALKSASINNR